MRLVGDMGETARSIIEDLLDRTGRAMLTGDFGLAMECFAIPYQLETLAGLCHIETAEEFRTHFDEIVAFYRANGVTDMNRRCVMAEQVDDNTITTLFETRMVQFTTMRLREPFSTYAVVRRINGAWRVSEARYLIDDCEDHNRVLLAGGTACNGTEQGAAEKG